GPEADQQKAGQAGQFPEHQHQQQVFGKHHAEHGAHEQQQVGKEAARRLMATEVVMGVENDQQANAEDHQGEQECQAVQTQAEVQAELGQPGLVDNQCLAGKYPAGFIQQQAEGNRRCQGGGQCAGETPTPFDQGRQKGAKKGQQQYQCQ